MGNNRKDKKGGFCMCKKFLITLMFMCVIMCKVYEVKGIEDSPYVLEHIDEKVIYLTFDDGPSPNTKKVLDILNDENVKASFFVIGNQIDNYKEVIEELEDSGMCILPHTYTHEYRMIYKSADDYFNDLQNCKDKIEQVLNKKIVNFIRFPGGVHNELLRKDVFERIKQKFLNDKIYFIEWNVYGFDAERNPKTSYEITNSTIRQLGFENKAIVLLHDGFGNKNTVKALRDIIRKAKKLGYKFRTLEEITEKDFDYFIKKNVINKIK